MPLSKVLKGGLYRGTTIGVIWILDLGFRV